ncbi:MAG: DUF1192 domain-containing protein [Rhizobium sp.]|nr:DUF1192 domain-containing protein [Rhizobium sp.]MBX9456379.1 DUF1192 domain-containing protein [Rhizobium sp.]
MSLFDDDKPLKKPGHEIGSDLSMLSVDELRIRVALLASEIDRLEAAIAAKSSSRNTAEDLFRK